MQTIYLNGKFVREDEAFIPVSDRGLIYGDGVCTTIQVREGRALFIHDHLRRVKEQCEKLQIAMALLSLEVIEELIARNPISEGIGRMRILVTAGSDLRMRLPARSGSLIVTLAPYTPSSCKRWRMALFSQPLALVHAHIKTLANFNRCWIAEEALMRGFDDGISVTAERHLLEAAFGNLFWVEEEGVVKTPAAHLPLYSGVTLSKVKEIVTDWGWRVEEVCVRLDEIAEEAAFFRTGTMMGIVPIVEIEGREFPYKKELHEKLVAAYEKRAMSLESPYAEYLPPFSSR